MKVGLIGRKCTSHILVYYLSLLSLLAKHILVQLDKLKEGLRGGVVVAALGFEELLRDLVDKRKAVGHELDNSRAERIVAKIDLVKEFLGNL